MTKLSIVRFYQLQKDKFAKFAKKKIGRNLLEDPDHPFAFFLSNQFVVSTFFRGKRLKVYAMDRKVFFETVSIPWAFGRAQKNDFVVFHIFVVLTR